MTAIYITYSNDFHGTSARVRVTESRSGQYDLSRDQVRRIRAKLCGVSGCTCGGVIGQRGPNEGDGTPCQWPVEGNSDGTATIRRPW